MSPAKERRALVWTAPRQIVGRGYGEIRVEILGETRQPPLDARLMKGVRHRFVTLDFGLSGHLSDLLLSEALGSTRRLTAIDVEDVAGDE
jgi:hypothetical protein